MPKYYGKIGYAVDIEETTPGVYVEQIVERSYCGDLVRNNRKLLTSDKVNDGIDISNDISIVADAFAYNNIHTIRYAEFMGTRWKVTNVDVQRPRLVLSLGGIYNG